MEMKLVWRRIYELLDHMILYSYFFFLNFFYYSYFCCNKGYTIQCKEPWDCLCMPKKPGGFVTQGNMMGCDMIYN